MRNLLRACFALTAISHALAFQSLQPSKTTYERRGLYHAPIHGRVVDPAGQPVPGVTLQLRAGRPRALPLASVLTTADGRFSIPAVHSIYPPYLAWFPPEGYFDGQMPLLAESGSSFDAGLIRLRPATFVRASVEFVGGAGPSPAPTEVFVHLRTNSEIGPVVTAERAGPELALRGIPFAEGVWRVGIYNGRKNEEYSAPFRAPFGSRNRKFTLRLLRDSLTPNGQFALQGRMEVVESIIPDSAPAVAAVAATGKVLAPDGSPVPGAFVSNFNIPIWGARLEWTRTGPGGEFLLRAPSLSGAPAVSYGDSDYWNLYPNKSSAQPPYTLVMPHASRLAIRPSGPVNPAQVRAAWWHDSFSWQPLASLRPWFPAAGLIDPIIRVTAPGYLPLTHKLEIPSFNRDTEPPPSELPLDVHFDPSARRTLSVLSAGRPLPGAIVDVESVRDLASDRRRFLDTFRLPPTGRLELLGAADQLIEVFVYAGGYEPRRAIWNSGVPLVLDLTPRNARLDFPATSTAAVARIRLAGQPRAVRTLLLTPGRPSSHSVAPGLYDLTCYGPTGRVAGYQRLEANAARPLSVDCAADQRPRLTVTLPAPGWRLSITSSTPAGGATQWAARIAVPGLPGFAEVDATPAGGAPLKPVITLSHAGRWHIEARQGNRALSLWRDIDLQPGQSTEIALPETYGTLRGSMRTYGGGLEREVHGFAGPRLQLIATAPGGWSVTEYLPERDAREGEERHRFTLTGIPPGDYHLHHHLIGKPYALAGGNTVRTYTAPIPAWGGLPVHIEASSTTTLDDFSLQPLAPLDVRVHDAAGRPVEQATLRIRDRMSEAWRPIEENPGQLEQAAHPIPYPAAARLQSGRATLPNIRQGWLELAVELDSGSAYSYSVPVTPGRELTLTLPPAPTPSANSAAAHTP